MYDFQARVRPERDFIGYSEPVPGLSAEIIEGGSFFSLKDFLRVIWQRLWVIVLSAMVLGAAALAFSLLQVPTYQASIKVLVGQKQEEATPGTFAGDVMALQEITLTMAEAVNSRPVAEATIEELDLKTTPEALLGSMRVEPVEETQFIRIDYRDTDPERARETANTIGEVFSDQVSEVSPSASSLTATVWEPAVTPVAPVSPNPVRNTFLALVLGVMIGVALAFLLEHLDDRWRSPEEAEQVSGVPTFGVVRAFKVPRSARGAS